MNKLIFTFIFASLFSFSLCAGDKYERPIKSFNAPHNTLPEIADNPLEESFMEIAHEDDPINKALTEHLEKTLHSSKKYSPSPYVSPVRSRKNSHSSEHDNDSVSTLSSNDSVKTLEKNYISDVAMLMQYTDVVTRAINIYADKTLILEKYLGCLPKKNDYFNTSVFTSALAATTATSLPYGAAAIMKTYKSMHQFLPSYQETRFQSLELFHTLISTAAPFIGIVACGYGIKKLFFSNPTYDLMQQAQTNIEQALQSLVEVRNDITQIKTNQKQIQTTVASMEPTMTSLEEKIPSLKFLQNDHETLAKTMKLVLDREQKLFLAMKAVIEIIDKKQFEEYLEKLSEDQKRIIDEIKKTQLDTIPEENVKKSQNHNLLHWLRKKVTRHVADV